MNSRAWSRNYVGKLLIVLLPASSAVPFSHITEYQMPKDDTSYSWVGHFISILYQ